MALTAEQKVGAFSLLAIVILGVVTFHLGKVGDMWKKWAILRVHFRSAAGLETGSPVYLAGVKVGKVETISFEHGKVLVVLKIEQTYLDDVREDSKVYLQRDSLLGQWHVSVTLGDREKPALDAAEPIKGHDPPDLVMGFQRVLEDIESGEGAFARLNVFFKEAADAASAMTRLLDENAADVRRFISQLNEHVPGLLLDTRDLVKEARSGSGLLTKMLTDEKLATNVSQAAASLAKVAEAVEKGDGTLGRLVDDPAIYNDLRAAAESAKRIAQQAEKGDGAFAVLLSDQKLAQDIKDAVRSATAVIARLEKGEGLLGRLMTDKEIFPQIKTIMAKLSEAIDGLKEQVPISAFGSVVFSAF